MHPVALEGTQDELEWIFSSFMGQSAMCDLSGKEVCLGTESEVIMVWFRWVPVHIESENEAGRHA